ncbi:MAG: P1 family peptidase [Alphaproteobacteria bacterium]|nr:P1 family peptidase [Alphaproteobacteria bacterium]MCB9699569.1 P1 family peptidase [Alphaproteobacteria bacterium]
MRGSTLVGGRHPTGALDAITDVVGVRVGHSTVIEGDDVRTGVTAIHPHEGSTFRDQVPAAITVLNGAGEITGRSQVEEYGLLESPLLLTSTHSVGTVHAATIAWMAEREELAHDFVIPVVAETYDGFLNDVLGDHVRPEHVRAALDGASGGPVARGNVGGGTGMALFHFKGGIGTASRVVTVEDTPFTVGVLVQGNYGRREHLRIGGVRAGEAFDDLRPLRLVPPPRRPEGETGSVLVIVATDAPLSDRQLARLSRRAALGIGRTGGIGGHSSGDLMLAFSNAPSVRVPRRPLPNTGGRVPLLVTTPRLHDAWIDPLFEATIEATESAVFDAMLAAETLVGRGGNTLYAIPHDRLEKVLSGG